MFILKSLNYTVKSFFKKHLPTNAAATAYFTLITLFPAFLLMVSLGDKFIKIHGVSREIAEKIISVFPPETRGFLITNLDTMISSPNWESMITYASIFIWAGMWVFSILEDALNKAWNVNKKRSFLKSLSIHLFLILISSFFLISSGATIVGFHILRLNVLFRDLPYSNHFLQIIFAISAFIFTTLLFTIIYKVLPDTKVLTSKAFIGGLIASIIWHIGNYIFVLTIPYFHYEQVYGSIWAIVIIVVWIYVSSWIFIFCGQLIYYFQNSEILLKKNES